jgi:hypothetical protein
MGEDTYDDSMDCEEGICPFCYKTFSECECGDDDDGDW